MHTLQQGQKAIQQTTSPKVSIATRAHFGLSRSANSPPRPQQPAEGSAAQQLLEADAGDAKGDPATRERACSGHDFGRISLHSKKPLKIQAKLTVSTPGDPFEREADQVADSVMAGHSRPINRISQGVQPKIYRLVVRPEDAVDSMPAPETEPGSESPGAGPTTGEVQRSADGAAGAAPPHVEQSLQQSARGGGEALPSATRSFMEGRFGWDFSSVRVHSNAEADALAHQLDARAFTVDSDIFFAKSQYRPDRPEGRHLLAHELTHVVQQSAGRVSRQVQRVTTCSSYPGYDASVDLATYNCAGLATRTYQRTFPASAALDSIQANFANPQTPSGNQCGAGKVKFWLWEYQMHSEDDRGTRMSRDHPDFHIVAGRADATGADPTNVYSKNGLRTVKGPGTGPGFRPAPRERYLSNDASETPATLPNGRPHFVVRSNMTEAITCAGCYPFGP